jgi:hypothetical protein
MARYIDGIRLSRSGEKHGCVGVHRSEGEQDWGEHGPPLDRRD